MLSSVDSSPYETHPRKSDRGPFAKLGRKGGKKGGPARAAAMTAQQRSESARKAVTARWKKAKEN
jgi:hypothetical protein